MVDVVDSATRSRMMAGIRGKHTRPELLIRKGLFSKGFRYRLHGANLPGKPDLVFRRYRAVVFVNGCFWHGHNCHLFKFPKSNVEFWRRKINANQANDRKARFALGGESWRILTVWECALKGKYRRPINEVLSEIEGWLLSNYPSREIRGRSTA